MVVLGLSEWLSRLHALPRGLLVFLGIVNLLYAAYSYSLARRTERPMLLIKLLVVANAAWALVCLRLVVNYWDRVTVFGVGHLVGEAIFVGGLAALEWNQRERLTTAP